MLGSSFRGAYGRLDDTLTYFSGINSSFVFSNFKDGEEWMKFKPLGDRVLVRRTDEEETSEGGIVIPGSAAEKPSQGEVLAVGPGKTLDNGEIQAVSVKKGDMVVFGQYAGSNTVKVDRDELVVLNESDILGVLEK